jgi:fluoroquinolone resistance protein
MEFANLQSGEFTSQEFKKVVLRHGTISRVEFHACAFLKCTFSETTFAGCRFVDCAFKNCDLSLASLQGSAFQNTRFSDSQLIGVDWTQTTWADIRTLLMRPVDFFSCALNHSTFMGLSMRHVQLEKCVAHEVSFEEADLTRASCTFTDFSGSRFLRTNLSEADFTGASNYTISPQLNTLKKTKFSLPEAMALLYGLDIILTES